MPRERERLYEEEVDAGGSYFSQQKTSLELIPSGAAVLDCTIGGGWALSRIVNIVGDEFTGKTLLAIEACANFHQMHEKAKIFYREAESAFEEEYAEALGMPVDAVSFIEPEKFETVEDFYDDLTACAEKVKKSGLPGLYVVDSLDALSDKAEQKEKFDAGTYGTSKAKQMAKLLRMCKGIIAEARMCLIIISQTRDKIGAMFAQKTRSGGRALNFYASQIIWLNHVDDVRRTVNKVQRVTGIRIKAKCTKNKIALPHRQCEFVIRFGHGVDSMTSNLDWLEDVQRLEEVTGVARPTYKKKLAVMDDVAYWNESRRVDKQVVAIWRDIEDSFLDQPRAKYR